MKMRNKRLAVLLKDATGKVKDLSGENAQSVLQLCSYGGSNIQQQREKFNSSYTSELVNRAFG